MVFVGEADSGEQAVTLVDELEPDLVLMDVCMPGLGGVGAAQKIKETHPATVVALISTTNPAELSRSAAECPADALIWKRDLQPDVLVELWERHRKA
jgi:YesN/AraC family two-component response regulator